MKAIKVHELRQKRFDEFNIMATDTMGKWQSNSNEERNLNFAYQNEHLK